MTVRDAIQALPKAELHLHIEGAVPWAAVRASAPEPLPDAPVWWADDFRFDDFTQFRVASRVCFRHVLTRVEAYATVAALIFADLAAQHVRYVELSFDAVRVAESGLAFGDVVAAIKKGAAPGLTARVFGAFSRHKHDRTSEAAVAALLDTEGLDGIDLHGDETHQSAPRFAAAFAEARRRGLATKAHAGEHGGPASIRATLDTLGVDRIEHGIRAVEDDALVARLARERITLDVCPWSNVKLRVWPDLASHPIRRLHERGVRVTVSTDNPTVFGRRLTDDLLALVDASVLAPREIATIQANAFDVAAIPAGERAAAHAAIRAVTSALP